MNSLVLEGEVMDVNDKKFTLAAKDCTIVCTGLRPVKHGMKVRIVGRLHSEGSEITVIVEYMEMKK